MKDTHTPPPDPALLAQYGYQNGTPLLKITLKGAELNIEPMGEMHLNPPSGLTWGANECVVQGSRYPRQALYIPGVTRFTFDAPLGYLPSLYILTTERMQTQAIADMKQSMQAILRRLEQDAQQLVERFATLRDAVSQLPNDG